MRTYPTFSRSLAIACFLCAALTGSAAHAAPTPTSATQSLISGRTMQQGETMLALSIGWPQAQVGIHFAPSSNFNFGFEGGFAYGSPYRGFYTGLGTTLGVPMRILVFSKDRFDFSVYLRPQFFLGQAHLLGYEENRDISFGFTMRGGALAGFAFNPKTTFAAGLMIDGGFHYFDPDPDHVRGFVRGMGMIGIEYAPSSSMMLFAQVAGGYGSGRNVFRHRYAFETRGGIAFNF